MRCINCISIIILSLVVSACATSIPAGDKERIAPLTETQGTVYIFNTLGGVVNIGNSLRVNGKEIGSLGNKYEYTWFHLSPGDYFLGIYDPSFDDRKLSVRNIGIKEGEVIYLAYTWEQTHNDGALLGDIIVHSATGKQGIAPDLLEVISIKQAEELMVKYTLVGNTLN